MGRPRKEKPEPSLIMEKMPLGVSQFYAIKKYGLYDYQVILLNEHGEVKIGAANVYGVVASDLVDLMFREINPEESK